MKKRTLLLFLICFLTAVPSVFAQNDTITSTASTDDPGYPLYQTGFYAGIRGGYLLKNKSLYDNPLYHLGSGLFAEVNGGWRKNAFGWELAVGMLNIKRDHPQIRSYSAAAEDVLRSMGSSGQFQNALDSGQARGQYFNFPENTQQVTAVKDFKGYYALTGPRLWFGRQKLQGSVYAQGGVAMSRFGYYYLKGNGASPDSYTYSINNTLVSTAPAARAAAAAGSPTTGTATVNVEGNYEKYGMSSAFFDAYKASGAASPVDIKEKNKMQFLARGGASLEFFFSPKASLSLGVDYWYIPSPEMKGQSASDGTASGVIRTIPLKDDPTVQRDQPYSDKYAFTNPYTEKKNLGFLSASLGLKIWFGKKRPAPVPEIPEAPVVVAPAEKNLAVKVIDKPTGKPLDGVNIKIEKEGDESIIETMTMEDGSIPLQKALPAGNYQITGIKNGIKTTDASVAIAEFSAPAVTIYRELIHNDIRFTLAGKTINKADMTPLPFIQTSLTNVSKGSAEQQTSDSIGRFNYQLDQNTDYNVIAQNKGYFSNREKVTTKGLNRSEVIYVNLALEVMELKKDASIVLKDIYYDYNKSDIRPDAAMVLDNLVQALQENPTIKIELSSHTDSRGGDAFNMTLSRKRAESAVRYLVGKGISADRLKARGYGETHLLNDCGNDTPCSEEQHQLNRRTEIKVIE
ncbi:OmpA family protein [Niabella beijingensis]|uniref:OmpA family protein n=1 Tax=Niabella beijingensis TaxID=2872700 RepID=UPI001CBFC2D4|nr:OmpA family protein [Niabella beijingensis]MBZ4189655.1 OmpA family protein [Niabella beijingensis]